MGEQENKLKKEQEILKAIKEAIQAFLEDLNVRLVPIRLEFESLLSEPTHELQALMDEHYDSDHTAETTIEVSASLAVNGETQHSMWADFDVTISLTGFDDIDVQLRTPLGLIVRNGDVVGAQAEKLMKELIEQNLDNETDESESVGTSAEPNVAQAMIDAALTKSKATEIPTSEGSSITFNPYEVAELNSLLSVCASVFLQQRELIDIASQQLETFRTKHSF
jgi:hypothetical protein